MLWTPQHKTNLKTLAANGYSSGYVNFTILSQGILSTLLVAGVKDVFAGRWSQGDFPPWDPFSLVVVLFNLILAEAAFTVGHSLLHLSPTLAHFHVMHHACVEPTITTNLIFHPIDLSIEIGGAVTAVILSHLFIFADPMGLSMSLLVIHLWYAYDHDPNLNLYHIQHHRYIDSVYVMLHCVTLCWVVLGSTVYTAPTAVRV